MKTAKMKGLTLTISTPTVINIVKTWNELLLIIEEHFHPVLLSTIWQIDDVFQPRPHRLWWYITNVLAVDQRYWLASHVSINRNAEASIKALQQAVSRARYDPILIQCDGLHSHATAIKKVLHNTRMDQKSKPKDISIVNYIERLNRTMRRGQITKGKNFTTIELLQAAANLTRMQYNFLEPHKSLKGKTPAQAAGIKLNIQSWKDLIKLASRLRGRQERPK
jgi:transposase InsO family protein